MLNRMCVGDARVQEHVGHRLPQPELLDDLLRHQPETTRRSGKMSETTYIADVRRRAASGPRASSDLDRRSTRRREVGIARHYAASSRLSYHASLRPDAIARGSPGARRSGSRIATAAASSGTNASPISVRFDAVSVRDRADDRHAEPAHAPREAHHQRRHRRGADRRERLAEDDVHRQRRLQEESADRQHDDEGPARQQRRGQQERRRQRRATRRSPSCGP